MPVRSLFDRIVARRAAKVPQAPRAPRVYRCQCGGLVFFRNSVCLRCGFALGFDPEAGELFPLQPGPQPDSWIHAAQGTPAGRLYYRCVNLHTPAGCNWLVTEPQDQQVFCRSCRLNRTIPDLSLPENALLWHKIEIAKRRLVSSLLSLHLPVASRVNEDPQRGLAFDFLKPVPGGAAIWTGHGGGLITINIEEADDARREQVRQQLHEPYRTLLGHFRHEVGHYYWDRLVDGTPWLDLFREVFGDERDDYNSALQRNYQYGPPPDWSSRFVSAYASAHPWEDFAETWAHYLHMADSLDTARSFGLKAGEVTTELENHKPEALLRPDDPDAVRFLSFLNQWTALTAVMNELTRSMGQQDFYPFVLAPAAVAKLQFVHMVIGRQFATHKRRRG